MSDEALRARALRAVASIPDPEIPVLTIADLGILRDVSARDGRIEVVITPTYSGCPAMDVIRADIERALEAVGFAEARVRLVLSPAWTTDWMSEEGRQKLREFGIAPPAAVGCRPGLFDQPVVPCPRCGSTHTVLLSAFGSTACKSLRRCESCREPFDHFKCH